MSKNGCHYRHVLKPVVMHLAPQCSWRMLKVFAIQTSVVNFSFETLFSSVFTCWLGIAMKNINATLTYYTYPVCINMTPLQSSIWDRLRCQYTPYVYLWDTNNSEYLTLWELKRTEIMSCWVVYVCCTPKCVCRKAREMFKCNKVVHLSRKWVKIIITITHK